jgi:ABC-type transport system involved in multi-copper enzyme maturation permease subunit
VTAVVDRPGRLATVPGGHYRFRSVIRSEWTKMWSVRSTSLTLLGVAVLTIALSIVGSAATDWSTMSASARAAFDPTSQSLQGVIYSQLVIGVLGALLITSEHATGTIRISLAAAPSRGKVIAAKALVFAAVAGVVGEILSFAAFFAGQALLRSPAPHATLGQPEVLRAVAGSGILLMVLGLLAFGLGTIIRHTAGAITAYVIVLLVAPLAVGALPQAAGNAIDKYLPAHMAGTMASTLGLSDHPQFSPAIGLLILAGYTALALGVGAALLRHRDV